MIRSILHLGGTKGVSSEVCKQETFFAEYMFKDFHEKVLTAIYISEAVGRVLKHRCVDISEGLLCVLYLEDRGSCGVRPGPSGPSVDVLLISAK